MVLQSDTHTTALTSAAPSLEVSGLRPDPDETWNTMRRFSGPTPAEIGAMRQTVDVLFQRGYELVTSTYDYLRKTPETAAILGWEQGVDDEHLAERRRFFTLSSRRGHSIQL